MEKINELISLLQNPERSPFVVEQIELLLCSMRQFAWLLEKFPQRSRICLAKNMVLKTYEPDEVLFVRGSESDSYIIILDGQVSLYSTKFADENSMIRVLGSGDALGEIGIIRKKPRALSCISNGCSILSIDVPTFNRTMKISVNKQVEDKISFVSK